jgi:hypothetical protein
MNRPPHLSIAHSVRSRILNGAGDRFWTYADFPHHARMPVAATFSRLTKEGVIRRLRRGIYYRPRNSIVGASRPDPEALVDKVLHLRGAKPLASGLGQYNRFGFTTQMSSAITRAVRRPVSGNLLPGIPVYFSARPLDRQRGIRPDERTVLDALRDLARIPDATPGDVLLRLKTLLRTGCLNFERLARYALAEPPRVRALLGAIGEDIRNEGGKTHGLVLLRSLAALRAALNPLSDYDVPGASAALAHGSAWRIR